MTMKIYYLSNFIFGHPSSKKKNTESTDPETNYSKDKI